MSIIFNRVWAMPSKDTFTIKPIEELIHRYVGNGVGWLDPFAGNNSPAEITNDLNPEKPTMYHLEAKEFIKQLVHSVYNGLLFDPPYSVRQIKECYEGIGLTVFQEDTQMSWYSKIKDLSAPKIKVGGYVISFGWNSNGFGINRGFEIIEILIVAHGGHKNDTIVTVERKTQGELNL